MEIAGVASSRNVSQRVTLLQHSLLTKSAEQLKRFVALCVCWCTQARVRSASVRRNACFLGQTEVGVNVFKAQEGGEWGSGARVSSLNAI
jgi:hypothetical protein